MINRSRVFGPNGLKTFVWNPEKSLRIAWKPRKVLKKTQQVSKGRGFEKLRGE